MFDSALMYLLAVSITASSVLMRRNWLVYAITPWLGIGGLVGHCSVLLIAEPKGEASNRDALSSPVCMYVCTYIRNLRNCILCLRMYIGNACAIL